VPQTLGEGRSRHRGDDEDDDERAFSSKMSPKEVLSGGADRGRMVSVLDRAEELDNGLSSSSASCRTPPEGNSWRTRANMSETIVLSDADTVTAAASNGLGIGSIGEKDMAVVPEVVEEEVGSDSCGC
jgi:hypothetical protein